MLNVNNMNATVLISVGLLVIAALAVLWPGRGVLARSQRAHRLAERARVEDTLKHMHARELRGPLATVESLAGVLRVSVRRAVELIATMEGRGLVHSSGIGLKLTERGRPLAVRVIRAHRLLERDLADELSIPLAEIHAQADRREHALTAEQIAELEAQLGYPRHDPHGDPIPTSSGALPEQETTALSDWPEGRPAKIVHLEDEPTETFAQIVAAGLLPGMNVEVLEATKERLVVWDGASEFILKPIVASNVFVADLPHAVLPPLKLASLEPGQSARVLALRCEGANRRRLLDLGLTPGTVVECAFAGPVGEPLAYRVRGALIALRREQAEEIEIEEPQAVSAGGSS